MQNTKLLSKKYLKLLEVAKKYAKEHYKKNVTSMSSVLLTKKGNLYTSINVKYKNIWKCICGERVVIAKALESKDTSFDTIVTVKYYPENNTYKVINMCGECLQISINHKTLKVIVDDSGLLRSLSINKVLPFAYV